MTTTRPSRAVLITGCSTGIGRATAQHFAEKGWTTYATARRPETLRELESVGCRTLALDVCDEESMASAVKEVEREEGAVGVLVNNAGYSLTAPIEEAPMDEVRRQFETNVFGLVRMAQLVLPGMRAQGWGRIVNVSSMGGKLTFPGMGFYHGTKYAVEAISDALRYEVRPFGVKVVVIEPGLIRTAFSDTATGHAADALDVGSPYAEFHTKVVDRVTGSYEGAMGMMATGPETVARAIERAASSSRPRPRYIITVGAKALRATRVVLPDRAWDLMLRSQFPEPQPAPKIAAVEAVADADADADA
jgi:NAD(P)-dependent dehydrogenase (short-subunit alcohol dehydrogenase family)